MSMLEDPSRKFIVVSACGKEDSEDHKITDLLYLCQAHIRYGVSYEPLLQMIEDKYRRIKKNLKLKIDLDQEFYQIREILKKDAATDYLVSRGEYLTGLCMYPYLKADFVESIYLKNDELNEKYPEDTLIRIAHKAKFPDQETMAILSLIVPLFVSAFQRAEDLANAMEARGYAPGEKRTRYKVLKMTGRDWMLLAGASLVLIAMIWLAYGR